MLHGNEAQCALAYPIDESTINRLMARPLPTAGGAATPLGNWNHEVGAQDIASHTARWRFAGLHRPACACLPTGHNTAGTVMALAACDTAQRNSLTKVQLAKRHQTRNLMARVSARARACAHTQASDELKSVEGQYKRLADIDIDTLSDRASWSVQPAAAST